MHIVRSHLSLTLAASAAMLMAASCGTDEEETQPNQQIQSQWVSLLSVQEDPTKTTFYTHHSIHLSLGVTANGPGHDTKVIVGLMEQPAANATDAQLSKLATCTLGAMTFRFEGGQNEQVINSHQMYIPHDCLDGITSGTFNLWVAIDPEEQVSESAADADVDNLVVFNQRELKTAANQACHAAEEKGAAAGCVASLKLKKSPGIDLALSELDPRSSVGILFDVTDHPDTTPGGNEHNPPLLQVSTTATLWGGDDQIDSDGDGNPDSSTPLTKPARVNYRIWPEASSDAPLPLTIYDGEKSPDQPSGHSTHHTLTQLATAAPHHLTHDLHAEGATRTALETGGAWEKETRFMLEGCIASDQKEATLEGHEVAANNCRRIPVIVIRGESGTTQANSYSLSAAWKRNYGSKKSVQLNLDVNSRNVLDLSGAHSHSYAKIDIHSLIGHIKIFNAHADGDALVSVAGSGVDAGVQVFGRTVYSYAKSIPSYHYSRNYSISRKYCGTFSYGVIVLTLDVSLCMSGKLGLDTKLNIDGKNAAGASPFGKATRIGVVDALAKPHAQVDGTISAAANITVAKAGAKGNLRIVKVEAPLTGDIRWGLTKLSPPELTVTSKVKWKLDVHTLDGKISLFADTRKVKWCKKWWVKYPCGFKWKKAYSKRLATFHGKHHKYTLLNRKGPTLVLH